jgi:tetratricopeptide (TPR) repeat protein
MDEGLNYLQSFNPVESKAELLEKTLAGRKELVDYLEKLVAESATTGNKHQHLMIGPRGSGKTHVLRVLYNRVSRRKELKKKLTIAYLCEDEYGIASFLDFIIRLLRAFIKWDPEYSAYLKDEIDKLKKVPPYDQEKTAQQILLNHIGKTTCLIIVENISNIFTGMEIQGQRRLRDMLQQYGNFTIMASNQALFKDIQSEDKPFHNFFNITHLKRLTSDEAMLFLKSIAEWESKSSLLKFLDEPEGKGRIRAIYEITAGNHRLLVTFYQFLKTDYKNRLSQHFVKTINDLIPYYQSFMDMLSALQQKIVQYLCQKRRPSSVKEIAENCFSSQNTISKQISNLVRLKYVDAASTSGRETFYELAEPLLRICFEVKENRGGPVKLFIDFLGNLFSANEIKRKYMQYHILAKTCSDKLKVDFNQEQVMYREAIKEHFPRFFKRIKIDEFEQKDKDKQIQTYIEEADKAGAHSEILKFTSHFEKKDWYLLLKEAYAYGNLGEYEKAKERAFLVLKNNPDSIDTLLLISAALKCQGKLNESEVYLNKILELDKNNTTALNELGGLLTLQNRNKEAEQQYLKVLETDPNNELALANIGAITMMQGKVEDAFEYSTNLIKLNPKMLTGWLHLGSAKAELGDYKGARSCFLRIIERDAKNPKALLGLANISRKEKKYEEAESYFNRIVQLKETSKKWWILIEIGTFFIETKRFNEAINYFRKAIALNPQVIVSHINLVSILISSGDIPLALSELGYIQKFCQDNKCTIILIAGYESLLSNLLLRSNENTITTFLNNVLKLIEKHNLIELFYKATPQIFFNLLIYHDKVDINRFLFAQSIFKETFKDEPAMIVPLKFLNIGIRHLKKKEKNVLMEFTKEERNTFNKFV